MIQILNKRSSTHANHCEDSYYLYEDEFKIVGAVLDGCSTGYNSYFASQFIAYAFEKIKTETSGFEYFLHHPDKWLDFEIDIFNRLRSDIRVTMRVLNLTDMNFLSTVVFFVYIRHDKRLHVRFVGDGVVFVNGEELVNDEMNMPNYLAYHVNDRDDDFGEYIKTRRAESFTGVDDFSVCSDGIDSFVNLKNPQLSKSITKQFLVSDSRSIKLKNGLNKKFNILTNRVDELKFDDDHYWWDIQDDLTIIRYANI